MVALAEIADVEDRIGRQLDPDEIPRAQAALTDASAVVRRYTRRTFTQGTSTRRLRPVGAKVTLPDRPVTAVTSVATVYAAGGTETLLAVPNWSWDGGHEVYLHSDSEQVINLPEVLADLWSYRTPLVEVTWTHGYDEVPEDVVAVVAGKAVVAISLPASGGGVMASEGAEGYSYSLASFARSGPLGLSQADRMILDAYRPSGRTVELRG